MSTPTRHRIRRTAARGAIPLSWIAALSIGVLSICPAAYAQVQHGTIVFADFVPDEITIAADSRTTTYAGEYNDMECKISAFGDKFVFTMAGISAKPGVWSAHDIAREAWKAEAKPDQAVVDTVVSVAQKWISGIEQAYRETDVVKDAQQLNPDGDPVLATALFAASDPSAGVVLAAVSIHYDRELYSATGRVRFDVDARVVNPPNWVAGGHSEIVDELMSEQTDRAKSYMDDLRMQIADRDASGQRAAIAARLIELSIQLQPQSFDVGLPVDVVQLGKTDGVRWIQRKDNCPAD